MPAKTALSLFAFALLTGTVAAQPAPRPVDDKKLVTKVYNIKPLIGERGKAAGVADADAVVKIILGTSLPFGEMNPGTDGPQIIELDGGKLEVRATAKVHGAVKDLLDAIERLQDLAVDVKADVIELDAATYEKLLKALPKGKTKPPVLFATGEEIEGADAPAFDKLFEEMNKVLKTGRVVQTSSGRFVNGAEATVSARRTVVTFHAHQMEGKKPAGPPEFVKEGFGLVAVPVVSADRRFVRFKLTEQSTAITGIRKRDLGEIGGKPFVAQTPELEDLGATGSAVVADGGTMLFRLAYAPKDKVWVVVLTPTIFIQAEEDELKKLEKK